MWKQSERRQNRAHVSNIEHREIVWIAIIIILLQYITAQIYAEMQNTVTFWRTKYC